MNPGRWMSSFVAWLYHIVRDDIGRKIFALVLALLLWAYLFNALIEDRELEFPIELVETRQEAGTQAGDSLYVVVPDELIVLKIVPEKRVRVDVKGAKDVMNRLDMLAIVELSIDDLQDGADERTIRVPIVRGLFKARQGEEPEFLEFEPKKEELQITIARKLSADVPLDASNVEITGVPLKGHEFQTERIRVFPNTARITGPKEEIARIRADPTLLSLQPVDVDGKLGEVSQSVGLSQDLLDREVTLDTRDRVVDVIVPIDPRREEIQLVAVPVQYINEDKLILSRMEVVSKTETVDLVVRASRSITAQGPVWLREQLRLEFNWEDVSPNIEFASPAIDVWFKQGVANPADIEVLDTDLRAPQIDYVIKSTEDDG